MQKIKVALTFLFAIVMILAGAMHFINPEIYYPFIPQFLHKVLVNYASGVVEIMLGIGAITLRFRSLATLGILLLMLAFLPLHIMDVFSDSPAIGSHKLALIRLPLQFALIVWAWFISKK